MNGEQIEGYLAWLSRLASHPELDPLPENVMIPCEHGDRVSQGAVDDIYRGVLVQCTKEQYLGGVRNSLQTAAGNWVDGGDHIRAQIALEEVRRLDTKFEVFKKGPPAMRFTFTREECEHGSDLFMVASVLSERVAEGDFSEAPVVSRLRVILAKIITGGELTTGDDAINRAQAC